MRGTPSPKRIRRTFQYPPPTRRTSFYAADRAIDSRAPTAGYRVRLRTGHFAVAYRQHDEPVGARRGLYRGRPRVRISRDDWLLGGTALLDTVGGSVERLARDRSSAAFALAAVVVVIKSGAGILALLLLRPAWRGWRMIVALDIFAAAACACGAGLTSSSARWS
jgi:hypothetical protein